MENQTRICVECGLPFEAARRDKIYCSRACNVRAQRKRKLIAVNPTKPPTITGKADEEDVAVAIVAARTASNSFAQLGKVAPAPLRAGCARIAVKIEDAIESEGW